jgi:hypothetical protein
MRLSRCCAAFGSLIAVVEAVDLLTAARLLLSFFTSNLTFYVGLPKLAKQSLCLVLGWTIRRTGSRSKSGELSRRFNTLRDKNFRRCDGVLSAVLSSMKTPCPVRAEFVG